MSVIAPLLWLWLVVSLSVYGYRIYRRVTKGPKAPGTEVTTADPSAPVESLGPASALIQNPVAGFEAPVAADPVPSPPPVAPSVEPAPPTPTPIAPPAQPAWTAPAPGDLSTSERRVAREPISEAVAGIHLPCDLGPLVGDVSRIDPFDVAFITTTHDGDTVRGALAGELVRLGFQVATTSAYRLSASRATADLVVTIYPNPAAATEGGRLLFPSAGADSVVVRFQS